MLQDMRKDFKIGVQRVQIKNYNKGMIIENNEGKKC